MTDRPEKDRPPDSEPIPASVRTGGPVPFHKLGWDVFQDLCRDIVEQEPGISTCIVFGRQGEKQLGVDLHAPRTDGETCEVGQCKCYEHFPPREICKATQEFFDHWHYWKSKNVRRFILFVADHESNQLRLDQEEKQRALFKEKRIKYEVWRGSKIKNELRRHRAIAEEYLPPFWVDQICGRRHDPRAEAEIAVTSRAMASTILSLGETLAGDVPGFLSGLRDELRRGQRLAVQERIKTYKADTARWTHIASEAKARTLRFEASMAAVGGDIDVAHALLTEAREHDPAGDFRRVEALITLQREGAAAAIDVLGAAQDRDDRHLLAALLIQTRQAAAALEVLEGLRVDHPPSAETHRLRALADLAEGDLLGARLSVQKALEKGPDWELVQFTAAGIDYFSGLSSAVVPTVFPSWPTPVDWLFVKRDSGSSARLDRAAKCFDDLIALRVENGEDTADLETWRLAALSNQADAQERAEAYCGDLLEENPGHAGALSWAIVRGFTIDLSACEKHLRDLVQKDPEDLQTVVSLANLLLAQDRVDEAESVLADAKPVFVAEQREELWDHWQSQIHLLRGEYRKAAQLAGFGQILETWAETLESADGGSRHEAAKPLLDEARRAGDPLLLLQYCQVLAQGEQWGLLADCATELVESFGTADVLRLAILATTKAHRWALCVELLDAGAALFPNGKLPADLAHVRVGALFELGAFPQAARTAEAILSEEPSTENRLRLAQVYLAKGDLSGCAKIGRELLDHDDLTSLDALRVAGVIAVDRPDVARRLWKKGMDIGFEDEHAAMALGIGMQLGLDEESAPLIRRLQELGNKPGTGVTAKRLEDLPAFFAELRERDENLTSSYARGEVPVHAVATHLNVTLADLYHGRLLQHEHDPQPRNQFALLVRHGMRGRPTLPPDTEELRLRLDLTGLLMTAHLEILDLVERHLSPIRLPACVIPHLLRARDQLTAHQPAVIESKRQLLELVDVGQITTFKEADRSLDDVDLRPDQASLVSEATARGGFVVDYLPLRASAFAAPPPGLPAEIQGRVCNARSVVASLRSQGPLSETAFADVTARLGTEGVSTAEAAEPEPDSVLVCSAEIAELFSRAGVLSTVADGFQVIVPAASVNEARATLRQVDVHQVHVDWCTELIGRIERGIDTGTYELCRRENKSASEIAEGDLLSTLTDLMAAPDQGNEALWSEDRYLSGYWRFDELPILGIQEILELLESRSVITADLRQRLIRRLRAGNVRYLCLSADEILADVLSASVKDGALVETTELRVLRQYWAACLLDVDNLAGPTLPDGTPNDRSEVPFALASALEVVRALAKVWEDTDATEQESAARADWILDRLYVGRADLAKHLGVALDSRALLGEMTADLTALLLSAMTALESGGPDLFMEWLTFRLLDPAFAADPLLVPGVTRAVSEVLFRPLEGASPEVQSALHRRFYERLPSQIREELDRDADFLASIGLRHFRAYAVDTWSFKLSDFVTGAEVALRGDSASVQDLKSEAGVSLEATPDKELLRLSDETGTEHKQVCFEFLPLLSESPSDREAWLRDRPLWFDGLAGWVEQEIHKIVLEEEGLLRVQQAETLQSGSPALFYDDLLSHLRKASELRLEHLMLPDMDRLPGHLRMPGQLGGERFRDAFDRAGAELLESERLLKVIYRMWGLPVPLPNPLVKAATDLDPAARQQLVKGLLALPASPVSDVQLLNLLSNLDDPDGPFGRLARRRAAVLLTDTYKTDTLAFQAILRWVANEMLLDPVTQEWSTSVRLATAWGHAHRLFVILRAAGGDMDKLRGFFANATSRISAQSFRQNDEFGTDVAHPSRHLYPGLVVSGLAYALPANVSISESFKERFRSIAMFDEDLPQAALLHDVRILRNAMGSFLDQRDEVRLQNLLGDSASKLQSPQLRQRVEEALEALSTPGSSVGAWMTIWSVLRNGPPYAELSERIGAAVLETDFTEDLQANPSASLIALHGAASRLAYMDNPETVAHLRQQLKLVAEQLGGRLQEGQDEESSGDLETLLLETAFRIAESLEDLDPVEAVAEVIGELLETVPTLAERAGSIARKKYEFSPQESQHLVDLLIRARSL